MAGGLDRILKALFSGLREGTWVDGLYDNLTYNLHAPDFPLRMPSHTRQSPKRCLSSFAS